MASVCAALEWLGIWSSARTRLAQRNRELQQHARAELDAIGGVRSVGGISVTGRIGAAAAAALTWTAAGRGGGQKVEQNRRERDGAISVQTTVEMENE